MAGYLQENKTAVSGGRTKSVTVPALRKQREASEKITMLTCYDASFAS
ncbi:MAG TPA: 3-methyl-2-oxobutanoate hydroxymethyltransferase, partial [Burkholderiaceae bacterium]|nr:3-methyl-2-oxobutanoate hydroxymethyltransferase [Burkholderiaceae bacterium]